jgi:hypothetical protein
VEKSSDKRKEEFYRSGGEETGNNRDGHVVFLLRSIMT